MLSAWVDNSVCVSGVCRSRAKDDLCNLMYLPKDCAAVAVSDNVCCSGPCIAVRVLIGNSVYVAVVVVVCVGSCLAAPAFLDSEVGKMAIIVAPGGMPALAGGMHDDANCSRIEAVVECGRGPANANSCFHHVEGLKIAVHETVE